MKNSAHYLVKTATLATALITLSACVVEPAPGYYGEPGAYYGEPAPAAPPPVAVAPAPYPYGCCYAYPSYPPYYGYGYGYYGPSVGVVVGGGGRRWR